LYKKEENYEEALKYFYQAYDLDSGNENIKNYIMQCEKEDKNSDAFNLQSKTNKKSALIAGVIAVFLFALFLNLSGLSPLQWIENNIQGFEFAGSENQSAELDSETNSDLDPNNNFSDQKVDVENNQVEGNKNSDNKENGNSSLDNLGSLDLMQYQSGQTFLSLENIQKLKEREAEKEEMQEANTFLEEGTEQQLFNLALDYFSREDYQDAADIFKSIYNLTETDYLRRDSLFLLARSYEKMDNYQSAEHFYRIYLNEYPESNYYDEALYNLGLMLNEAGEEKKSKEVLERLRREEPYSSYNNSRVYEILNQ